MLMGPRQLVSGCPRLIVERASKRVRVAGAELRSWRKNEKPTGMSQEVRVEKADEGRKDVERNEHLFIGDGRT